MSVKILIVDDVEFNIMLMKKILAEDSYEIGEACNGMEALTIARQQLPDLIISDIMMPVMDGLSLCRELKRDKDLHHIPVIMYSSNFNDSADKKIAIELGATDFLSKSVEPETVRQVVSEVLEHKRSARESGKTSLETIDHEGLARMYTESLASKLVGKDRDLRSVLKYIHDVDQGKRLLLVEDNPLVLEMLVTYLSLLDYEFDCVEDGEKAVSALSENSYDLIITDVKMPGINGMQLLQYVKKYIPNTDVMVMTGYSDEYTFSEFINAGAIDFLIKPTSREEFNAKIQRALSERQLVNEYQKEILERIRAEEEKACLEAAVKAELEKRLEERTRVLNSTEAQLFRTTKLATIGEMATGLVHEFNQPLDALALVARILRKLLAKGKLTEAELESGLLDVEQAVGRMTRLAKHVQIFARHDQFEKGSVDLAATINAALDLVGVQLRQHDIEVIWEEIVDLPKIHGDPYQLEQVWINLLSNARDALDENESIMAQSSGSYRKKILISTHNRAEFSPSAVEVHISDNGIGMTEETAKKIFEPFFTSKDVGKGTGLGLSISLSIIEHHDGRIEVECSPKQGCIFKVFLPVEG